MRILLDELRLRRFSLTVWTLSVILTVAMVDLLYPSIGSNSGYDEVMQNMPEELQALFGAVDMSTPMGYLSIELYSFFLPAILIAYAVGRGAACVAGEEEGHTLDLLLAQPVSRTSVYLQKALAMVVGVVILSAASMLTTVVLAGPSDMTSIPLDQLFAVTLHQALLALTFGVIALAVAVATGRRGPGIAVAAGYAFLSYLVEGLGKTIDWLGNLRPLSPWNWYSSEEPLLQGISPVDVGVFAAVVLVVAAVGLVVFDRRDLHA
ncbi:MAG: ABC transporter permease subunit [Candidatus Nanopelagicales bacterium]